MRATVAALNEEFSFRRLVVVFAALADKDVAGMLEFLEPVADTVVITRNSSSRAMPAAAVAAVAKQVFGPDRVLVEPPLPDAIESAVALAEEPDDEGDIAGSGILITGSLVTVADARKLLKR
jgi:dihydrofolate synthase/folylpolyglutamate synthase